MFQEGRTSTFPGAGKMALLSVSLQFPIDTEICTILPMKTTLDINNSLLQSAKTFAAQQHTSLTRLIEEGLQLRLRAVNASLSGSNTSTPEIPVFQGKSGLVSGVNPLSNKAMLETMDSNEPQ